MMATEGPAPPAEIPAKSAVDAAFHENWSLLGDAIHQGRMALEAQLAVWKYSILQIVILIAISVPLSVCGFLLIIHGFLLLDSVLDIALSQLRIATWFSPLVRGAVYFGFPALSALIVGIGALPKTKKKKKDAHVKS
jgi:hypothetical protein